MYRSAPLICPRIRVSVHLTLYPSVSLLLCILLRRLMRARYGTLLLRFMRARYIALLLRLKRARYITLLLRLMRARYITLLLRLMRARYSSVYSNSNARIR
jgi:hypothetical protein